MSQAQEPVSNGPQTQQRKPLREDQGWGGRAGPLLRPRWAYRGEDGVGVAPHGHLVQPDGDPEHHADAGAPPPQVGELQAAGAV